MDEQWKILLYKTSQGDKPVNEFIRSLELKAQTNTENLEEAYLELTGKTVRDETLDTAAGRKQVIRNYIVAKRR